MISLSLYDCGLLFPGSTIGLYLKEKLQMTCKHQSCFKYTLQMDSSVYLASLTVMQEISVGMLSECSRTCTKHQPHCVAFHIEHSDDDPDTMKCILSGNYL